MNAIPEKILLIDDDELQYRFVQTLFRRFKGSLFDLEWAGTFDAGLERLLGGGHAACLLDYRLGAHTGLELLRQAAAAGCRTPIVFLTGDSSDSVDSEAMEAGAFGFLVKGEISAAVLERSLRHAIKLGGTVDDLRWKATRDPLTGLFNRGEFDRLLEGEVESARRTGLPLALVAIDVDRFKQANDTHGHPVGDAVLREVASRLFSQVRASDWIARIGGDEFAVVLGLADRPAALAAAERFCAALARAAVALPGGGELAVRISAGVAVAPDDAGTAADLVAAADRALYAAKERNRGGALGAAEA